MVKGKNGTLKLEAELKEEALASLKEEHEKEVKRQVWVSFSEGNPKGAKVKYDKGYNDLKPNTILLKSIFQSSPSELVAGDCG